MRFGNPVGGGSGSEAARRNILIIGAGLCAEMVRIRCLRQCRNPGETARLFRPVHNKRVIAYKKEEYGATSSGRVLL